MGPRACAHARRTANRRVASSNRGDTVDVAERRVGGVRLSAEREILAGAAGRKQEAQARLLLALPVARLVGADAEGDAHRRQRRHRHQQVQQLRQPQQVGRARVARLVVAGGAVHHAVAEEAGVDARLQLGTPVRAAARVLLVAHHRAHHEARRRKHHQTGLLVDRRHLKVLVL